MDSDESVSNARTTYEIEPGSPHPLGAAPDDGGVNFSLFSEHATTVVLLIFGQPLDALPSHAFRLDPLQHRTFHFWHVYVRGLQAGAAYAFRVDGPHDLQRTGNRFDFDKVLLDPFSQGLIRDRWDRAAASRPGDNVATAMRSIVVAASTYDWEGDLPLNRPIRDTIIYELHVRGFTRSPTSGCERPGTFSGLVEKLPYLKELGVTAVELLPIFAFDNTQVMATSPTGEPLHNFWGYDPIAHFVPHVGYCGRREGCDPLEDFRDMVKACHKAGVEVNLDVVFNHTGEGASDGPTINFKGYDNAVYYYTDPHDRSPYLDYSGCQNTLNCNHPIVANLIAECLDFWVGQMHVDGFRFDEASVLSRGPDGSPMELPPAIWHIELDDSLMNTKIIAEASDAAGLNQVGYFPGPRWGEWNGQFRDVIRRFVRGDPGIVGLVASRLAGSADLYQMEDRLPTNSVNFITSHDGFTLRDLVSFNERHNIANGLENLDGMSANLSWNCGVEGATNDPRIEELRDRQCKNFVALLLLAQGVPMLLAGDEVLRSQRGNNNTFCQDNELSWFDWSLVDRNRGMLRFVQRMIAFRKAHPNVRRPRFFTGERSRL